MSAMDGVTPVKELVRRAAQWGHKAVAITDHGVLQAYPDAFAASQKNKIKIIYGVEGYLLDDNAPIVVNSNNHPLEGEFVVLDIETTGLYAEKDRITEIGAVKVRDGKIVDEYSTFVNPEMPIPEFVQKLTGITNETVKDAPLIAQVLPEFLEFAGCSQCPL
jgi:DNA polymerase III subunit alpha, Gram-positive type